MAARLDPPCTFLRCTYQFHLSSISSFSFLFNFISLQYHLSSIASFLSLISSFFSFFNIIFLIFLQYHLFFSFCYFLFLICLSSISSFLFFIFFSFSLPYLSVRAARLCSFSLHWVHCGRPRTCHSVAVAPPGSFSIASHYVVHKSCLKRKFKIVSSNLP